jgi:hypothetical protein
MKNPDEAIDRVMQGLREAKAPEGMEQRILRAMQQRTAEPRMRAVHPWLWSFGVASIAAVALIAVWVHRAPRQQIDQIAVKRTILTHSVTNNVAVQTPQSVGLTSRSKVKRAEKSNSASASSEDGLAMSEMMAPSQPAPSAPLTEQERLLLRIVHKGDPQELAMLGPVKRAAWAAKEKIEYENFFREPPVVPAEGGNE